MDKVLLQEVVKIVKERKKEKDIREIQDKTEINMKVWEKEHKPKSLFQRIKGVIFK